MARGQDDRLMTQSDKRDSWFLYYWAWKGHDSQRQRSCLQRQGQRCRVLVRGTMNSALLEFEDGFRTVTSRNGLRKLIRFGVCPGCAQIVTAPTIHADGLLWHARCFEAS